MTEPSTDAAKLVRLDVVDGVATITLDDPRRRNAASAAMSAAVEAACALVAADDRVRVVVLTGAGAAFSAGGDLAALADGNIHWSSIYRGFNAVAQLAVPVLVAVNGPVVGAGANFVLAGDLVIAARSAFFDSGFLDIGMHPGGGYLWGMQRRIGLQATAATALFDERLSAERAHQLGLVWRVVEDAELGVVAGDLATRVAARPTDLVRRTKAALRSSSAITGRRLAVDLEEVGQRWSVTRPAFAAGVAAVQERIAAGGAATRRT